MLQCRHDCCRDLVRKHHPSATPVHRARRWTACRSTCAEREFLAVVGPSGSGKTTLLRLVNRLVDPDQGVVRVAGEDVRTRRSDRAAPPHRLRVPGRRPVPAHDRRREHRHHPAPARLGRRRASRARVDELLELVRLDRAAHARPISATSSPAASASASASPARSRRARSIVLMDEPFGALDPAHPRRARRRTTARLHDTLGLTTVMITHDMMEALLLADRIAVMRDGRIVADGTPRCLMAHTDDDFVRELMADAAPAGRAPRRARGARDERGRPHRRRAGAAAGLSRRARAAQRDRARARARGQPAAGARSPMRRPALRRVAAGRRQPRADHSRAWRCWRCSIRCCSALAALSRATVRLRASPRSASCRRCWR